jgi:hypothetical protein
VVDDKLNVKSKSTVAIFAGGETPTLRDDDDVLEYERVVEAVRTDENVAFDDTVCAGVLTSEGE